jgi:hypothetical protein
MVHLEKPFQKTSSNTTTAYCMNEREHNKLKTLKVKGNWYQSPLPATWVAFSSATSVAQEVTAK